MSYTYIGENMSNKNDLNPLMFIDTISTNITKTSSQVVFDSRYHKKKKEVKVVNDTLYQKLNNIVSLYDNHEITCQIIVNTLKEERSIIGTPYLIDNNLLYVKVENKEVKIDINNIVELIIIKI